VGSVLLIFLVFVLSYYVSLRSEFHVVMSIRINPFSHKNDVRCLIYVICVCLVRLYLQLFVGGLMSYLRYLCLFAYSDVQHILCCVCFVFLRLVYPMLPFSLDCQFWLSIWYSLTFIYIG